MPAIPELPDIPADKRLAEVLRCLNTENIRAADRHQRIACKVKEQINPVGICIANPMIPRRTGVKIPHHLVGTCCNDHLVHRAEQQLPDAGTTQFHVLVPLQHAVPVRQKPAAAIDRPGTEAREKCKKRSNLDRRYFFDDPVIDLNDHLHDPERQI